MSATDEDLGASADRARPGSGFLVQVRLAAGFLTILPVMPAGTASEEAVAASFAYFPLVGFAIGVALAAEDLALSWFTRNPIEAALVILSMVVLTGAVHLDGLADTADALAAGRDRGRALAILRDSAIGSFGAIALFFVLGLKIMSLAALSGWKREAALVLAPGLARYSMVAVGYGLEYLRPSGAGSILLGRNDARKLMLASAIALGGFVPFVSWSALGAYAAALLVTAALRRFYSRWLGGLTGDLAGACGEIVETVVMLAFALEGGLLHS
jgi:adenosylcobinamide-GDP ribazoletransferase